MKVIDDHLNRGPESTLESRHLKSLDCVIVTPAVNTETPVLILSLSENSRKSTQRDPKRSSDDLIADLHE